MPESELVLLVDRLPESETDSSVSHKAGSSVVLLMLGIDDVVES